MRRKLKLIAFMNAYSQGKSGGDMVFIEVAKRLEDYDKILIASLLGRELCQKSGVEGRYLITTCESEFRNIIRTYVERIIKAFFLRIDLKKGDILLGTSDWLPDVLPIFWLKIRYPKNKWIQHIFHLIPFPRRIPFFAQRLSFLLIKQLADSIVVDNSLLKKDLIRLGFAPDKIFVNYPGINLDYLKSIKTRKKKTYDGVFMAQLRQQKGVFDLPKIWKLVSKQLPDLKLGIIGKGEERVLKRLKEEIKKEGLEKNIDLLGFLPDDEAFATIKASKVFIFPSHEEGFGIAPLEAQALGQPVVAWHLPVFDEIFPKGMVKIEIGNIGKFTNEVVRLLREEDLRRRFSKEAVSNASRFDWNKVAKRELELIERIRE